MGTRRIDMEELDQLPTERIELNDTTEEEAEFNEDTEVEPSTEREEMPLAAIKPRARGVFERLRRAGVEARQSSSGSVRAGTNRRRDPECAKRFDQALARLTEGDLEAAFFGFTELLEERPQSTRLWIFVRALQQAKTAGE